MHFSKIFVMPTLLIGAAAAVWVPSSNFTDALIEFAKNKTIEHRLKGLLSVAKNATKDGAFEHAIREIFNATTNANKENLSKLELEEIIFGAQNVTLIELDELQPQVISDGLSELEFIDNFIFSFPQDAEATDSSSGPKGLEARGGIGTGRPGRVTPCPGWPTTTRYNLTHTVEFSIRCWCNIFKKIKRTDCSYKPLPYWANP